MTFLIASSFTESLARLTSDEQKAVKMTAFEIQMNPANPGFQFHRLSDTRDKNFWSVRVNDDIRIIVHRTEASLLLCHVDHHDPAYRWAERRKLETHPKTGAAQIVEIRETIKEIIVPRIVDAPVQAGTKPPLFAETSSEELLGYGVPVEWLDEIRGADEDRLLEIALHLPAEAAEALLVLATGGRPETSVSSPATVSPFDHPDAMRRFRVIDNIKELERALEFPWEKWTVFLHPAQRQFVEADYSGPSRISGSAGTGKTVVALHRAVHLARKNSDARILLTTFSEPLAALLQARLRQLAGNEPRIGERVEVHSLDGIARRLYRMNFGRLVLATSGNIREFLASAVEQESSRKFTMHFLMSEWEEIVDARGISSWEEYRDVRRLGRKTRLPEEHRRILWSIFELVQSQLLQDGLMTSAQVFRALARHYSDGAPSPFEHCVADEAQDLSVPQLQFLVALASNRPNGLFFAGDMGQRIFQQPFSWKSLGVDIRGRSRILRINYRTSHQIRSNADKLLGSEIADVDGNIEDRRGTVSVFNGPHPEIRLFENESAEIDAVAAWLGAEVENNSVPHETAVFVRSIRELERANAAVAKAGFPAVVLDEKTETTSGSVTIGTMPTAKGLEFRSVAVMSCDDEVLPLQPRIEEVSDDSDLEEVYNTERHLLYVACTRARERLLITAVAPGSEFLGDLKD